VAYNTVEGKFTATLQTLPNKWCDLQDACDSTRVCNKNNYLFGKGVWLVI